MTKRKKTELLQGGIPCSAMGESDPQAPRELQGCTNMATRFVGNHPWCDDCEDDADLAEECEHDPRHHQDDHEQIESFHAGHPTGIWPEPR